MPRVRRARLDPETAQNECGSTLVEVLVATIIMGIAVVGLLVGSTVTWEASGQNRSQTNAGIVARDYAESLSDAVNSGSSWCQTSAGAYAPSYTVPTGYTVTVTFPVSPTCPSSGAQFQPVTITVTSNGDTETLKTVVRQP